ncbi:MAG: polysaccharide biosynthesis C-terminal domain-containing protein [Bacteroidota bacterium]
MGIIIRQSIKSSIVTYVGVVIGTINVLYLYNEFLDFEQFGLYVTLTSFPLVFAGIASLGTPLVGVRFFNQFSDEDNEHNGYLGYLLITPFIGFIAFIIGYWLFQSQFAEIYSKNSPLLIRYFWVFPIITFFMIYLSIFEAYCRVHLRIVVPAIIRELFLKLSNSLLAILFGFKLINFDQLVGGIVLMYALAVFFIVIYIKILGRLYLNFDFSFLKKPIFKQMYTYGFYTMLGGIAGIILPHIEKLMLPAFSGGLKTTAIFNIAASIGLVISIPRNTISAISDPLLAESWQKKDLAHIKEIYQKSALNLLIIGIFLFLGIWCNIDSIFEILPKSEIYKEGKWVVLMVSIYCVFDMATGLNSEILKNSDYYKYDFSFYVIRCILLIIANLVLIPLYSFNGAAFAMLVSIVIYNIIKFFFIKSKINIQPFSNQTLIVLFIGIVTYLVTLILPSFESAFLNILVKSITICLVFGLGIFYSKVSQDINNTVNSIKTRFLKIKS